MHKKNQREKQYGFTLIEVSIVLVIIGFLMTGVIGSMKIFFERQLVDESRKKTERIQQAISEFILSDSEKENDVVRFPCPALLNVPKSDPDFGFERCDLLDTNADGTISAEELRNLGDLKGLHILSGTQLAKKTGSNLVVLGALPVHTLGLVESDAYDVHRNKYIYAISHSQIENNYAAMGKNRKPGTITILNEGGGTITQTAQFFIYGAGEDGRGGISIEGRRITPCRNTFLGDAVNCNWQITADKNEAGKAVFRTQSGFSKGDNDYYYDDYTIYTTYSLDAQEDWWSSEGLDGNNIHNTNPGKVWVGANISNIKFKKEDRIVVDGQIRSIDSIHSEYNIIADGRIGIGTSSPEAKLHVEGEIKVGSTGQECSSLGGGALRFNTALKVLEFCNGDEWTGIVTQASFQTPQLMSSGTTHTAESSGIVTATISVSGSTIQNKITGYIDNKKIGEASAEFIPGITTQGQSALSFLVPIGSTWRIVSSSAADTVIHWSQIGL